MTDRELLEFAAKAAGARMTDYSDNMPDHWEIVKPSGVWGYWNPLTDDGDALRLAVKLRISIDPREGAVCVISACKNHVVLENFTFDQYPATRLAIVRAAAEIGRAI